MGRQWSGESVSNITAAPRPSIRACAPNDAARDRMCLLGAMIQVDVPPCVGKERPVLAA